ncbi:MAG: acetyl-CoA C-acetyltransferase [Cellvibrionaceae bacterium]|jgi:acetyl-CoA C-acetyltransferase
MMSNDVVIMSAVRTAIGGFQGAYDSLPAPALGAAVINALIERTNINTVDEVLMGNVLSAGLGQAPARQSALMAGLPESVACTTVSKVCGSGMKSVMLAYDQIKAGSIYSAIAGGMENMSLAPYFLPKARAGLRLGHGEIVDHLFYDGLQNASDGTLMGCFADTNAMSDGITRQQMDDYATESLRRAREATEKGYFKEEITPVSVKNRRDERVVDVDEQPANARPEKIPLLKPAFGVQGMVTAANASSIADGAAALLIMHRDKANELGLKPMAVIKGHVSYAQAPALFTHAPIGAVRSLLDNVGWTIEEVDLFEINEAFAMVALAAIDQLGIAHEKTNIHGGATALGHPIGASGARIIVTLLYALKRLGKKKGIASLCIGGGEATAVAVEMIY